MRRFPLERFQQQIERRSLMRRAKRIKDEIVALKRHLEWLRSEGATEDSECFRECMALADELTDELGDCLRRARALVESV